MKIKLFAIFICLCFLTGCKEAPQEVKDRIEQSGEINQMKREDCTYYTIEELRKTTRDTLSYEPGNLVLPDNIDFSDVEEIGVVTFRSQEGYGKNREDIADYFGIDVPKWEHYNEGYSWYEYHNADKYIIVSDNGRITYQSGAYHQLIWQDIYPYTIKKVHLNREKMPDFECRLSGEEVQLETAVKNADAWLGQCKYINPEFDYKLRTIYINEDDSKNDYLTMLYQIMYKGVGLSYITYPLEIQEDYSTLTKSVSSNIILMMETETDVSTFIAQNNLSIVEEDMADEVIDFESALKLVEAKMAGYSKLTVVEVRIEYILEPQYSPKKGESADGEGIKMKARPVYSFWILNGGYDGDGYGINEGNEIVYINVDMLDGTVTDNFEVSGFNG